MCDKGCVKVDKILQGELDEDELCDDRSEIIDIFDDQLSEYPCYLEIIDGDYGHLNYAVAAYVVKNGHFDCLKELYETTNGFMWHNDLASVAIENNRLNELKYILEKMGDIEDIKVLMRNAKEHGNASIISYLESRKS